MVRISDGFESQLIKFWENVVPDIKKDTHHLSLRVYRPYGKVTPLIDLKNTETQIEQFPLNYFPQDGNWGVYLSPHLHELLIVAGKFWGVNYGLFSTYFHIGFESERARQRRLSKNRAKRKRREAKKKGKK